MLPLRVDVWSDIACPWCYVGKRRLEAALAQFAERDHVHVEWHSFELNPEAPRQLQEEGSHAERLARKYRMSVADAERRVAHLTELARADGIAMDFEHIRPGNTFDAHRLVHLGAARGKQDAVKERFLRGYLSEGEPIGEPEALLRLAVQAGLDADEVQGVLASDSYAKEVRADEADAARLGIHGVPFFVLGGRCGVSGAQPTELLLSALQKAYAESVQPEPDLTEGAACGPDGC